MKRNHGSQAVPLEPEKSAKTETIVAKKQIIRRSCWKGWDENPRSEAKQAPLKSISSIRIKTDLQPIYLTYVPKKRDRIEKKNREMKKSKAENRAKTKAKSPMM